MEANEILDRIQTLKIPKEDDEYSLFRLEEKNIYYGIDKNNHISFLVESQTPNVHTIVQETKCLNFGFNIKAKIITNGYKTEKKFHILTCTSNLLNDIKAFVSLTEAFKNNIKEDNPFIMNELFSSLRNLFDDTSIRTDMELQGFFAELYIIYYLKYRLTQPIQCVYNKREEK